MIPMIGVVSQKKAASGPYPGDSWTELPILSPGGWLEDICWSDIDNQFVVLGRLGSNNIFISQDGLDWITYQGGAFNTANSITYGNGVYIVVGWDIWTSTDAINWIDRNFTPQQQLGDIVYGNGIFITIGTGNHNQIYRSDDNGITWTLQIPDPNIIPNSVYYYDGKWIIAGRGGWGFNLCTSLDNGITWISEQATTDTVSLGFQWWGLTRGGDKWVSTGDATDPDVMYSFTGDTTTWVGVDPPNTDGSWQDVIWTGVNYIAVSKDGAVRTMNSVNGIDWIMHDDYGDNTAQWYALANNSNIVIALARSSTTKQLMYSLMQPSIIDLIQDYFDPLTIENLNIVYDLVVDFIQTNPTNTQINRAIDFLQQNKTGQSQEIIDRINDIIELLLESLD